MIKLTTDINNNFQNFHTTFSNYTDFTWFQAFIIDKIILHAQLLQDLKQPHIFHPPCSPYFIFHLLPKLLTSLSTLDSSILPKTLNFNIPLKFYENNYLNWKPYVIVFIHALDMQSYTLQDQSPPLQFLASRSDDSLPAEHIQKLDPC